MYITVPDETRNKCEDSNDDNRSSTGDSRLANFANSSQGQSTRDGVDGTPSDASNNVQNDRDACGEIQGEGETGQCELPKAKFGPKGSKVRDGEGGEQVEKYDGQDSGSE